MGDNLGCRKNMNILQIETIEKQEEIEEEIPLSDDFTEADIPDATPIDEDELIFMKPKRNNIISKPKNNDKVYIEEQINEKLVVDEKPIKAVTKKVKKKRVLTEKQKDALKRGREKSLAIRKAKKLQKEKEKAIKKAKAQEKQEQKIKNNIIHKEYIKEQNNPYKDIHHFFDMMDKYEQYKEKRSARRKPKPPAQTPQLNRQVSYNKPQQPTSTGMSWYFE
jgi:hypothetical protein